jgi:hypothetical protein
MKTGSDAFKVEGFAIDDGDHDSLRQRLLDKAGQIKIGEINSDSDS